MPETVALAAVTVAHAQGKPVFTHPQNQVGVDNALAAGVDVLAHTIPAEGQYTSEELDLMKARHTALIPTLTLWEVELEKEHASSATEQKFVQAGIDELKAYFDEGGTILFGTDVGYHETLRHDRRICPDGQERNDLARHSGFAYHESGVFLQGGTHAVSWRRAMTPTWWCSAPILPTTCATSPRWITPSGEGGLFTRGRAGSPHQPSADDPLTLAFDLLPLLGGI